MNKIRLLLMSCCLATIVVFVGFIPPILAASAESDLEKRIEGFTLANGLQVLMLERHISPTVSLYIRYRVGAVDERDGKTGLAHFLEHMMFKGTKTIGARNYKQEQRILRQIAKTGQELDVETAKGPKGNIHKINKLKEHLKVLQEKHKPLIASNEIDRLVY